MHMMCRFLMIGTRVTLEKVDAISRLDLLYRCTHDMTKLVYRRPLQIYRSTVGQPHDN